MLVWIAPSLEEAAATRSLCYSTTQPLYQGTGKPKEWSQEALLTKCSTKSHLWSARLWVWALEKMSPLFCLYSALKLTNWMSCAYSCVLHYSESGVCFHFRNIGLVPIFKKKTKLWKCFSSTRQMFVTQTPQKILFSSTDVCQWQPENKCSSFIRLNTCFCFLFCLLFIVLAVVVIAVVKNRHQPINRLILEPALLKVIMTGPCKWIVPTLKRKSSCLNQQVMRLNSS